MERINFFKQLFLGSLSIDTFLRNGGYSSNSIDPGKVRNIKSSLNAYSFNSYLQQGKMNLDDLINYCATLSLDAVDLTGYYFPGYPKIPCDEYIYHIKQKAFVNGLAISGTGIRNDFTDPDPQKRADDIELIKNWILLASKLGAPVIRVFAGQGIQEGYSRQELNGWIVEALIECTEYGKAHGVMIGMQNHNDYLKNSEQVLEIVELVNSDWFGIILDVGSFSTENPYDDIAQVAPHAISWQIKENLGYQDRTVRTDLSKIATILEDNEYRGYIPIETLGGDPLEKVPIFLSKVINATSL